MRARAKKAKDEKPKKTKEQSERYKIDRNTISKLLCIDNEERKQCKWKLRALDDILHIHNTFGYGKTVNLSFDSDLTYVSSRRDGRSIGFHKTIDQVKSKLYGKYPFIEELFRRFGDNIVAAGGSVFWALHNPKTQYEIYTPNDVDIFFHGNLTEESATKLLNGIVRLFFEISEGLNLKEEFKPCVERNKHVTTILVPVMHQQHLKYQFIHRIYPTKDSIVGGFDIGPAMVLFDGKEIFATTIGAFCIGTRSILMDLSRRSTTYEKRIRKYCSNKACGLFIHSFDTERCTDEALNDVEMFMKRDYIQIGPYLRIGHSYNSDYMFYNVRNNYYKPGNKEQQEQDKEFDYDPGIDYYNTPVINAYLALNNKVDNVVWKMTKSSDLNEPVKIAWMTPFTGGRDEKYIKVYKKWFPQFSEMFSEHKHDIRRTMKHRYNGMYLDSKIFATEVKEMRQIIEKALANLSFNGGRIDWIVKSPGRQWTSSLNPVITKPSTYYDPRYYKPLFIGVPIEIETTIRLMRKRKGNLISATPRDLIRCILQKYIETNNNEFIDFLFPNSDV